MVKQNTVLTDDSHQCVSQLQTQVARYKIPAPGCDSPENRQTMLLSPELVFSTPSEELELNISPFSSSQWTPSERTQMTEETEEIEETEKRESVGKKSEKIENKKEKQRESSEKTEYRKDKQGDDKRVG